MSDPVPSHDIMLNGEQSVSHLGPLVLEGDRDQTLLLVQEGKSVICHLQSAVVSLQEVQSQYGF